MSVATINIQLDQDVALIYRQASAKKRDDIRLLFNSLLRKSESMPLQLMLASESVLAKEWDTPEEDEIWVHL